MTLTEIMNQPFNLHANPFAMLLLVGGVASMLYLAGLAVYRLYLSPIAKFPGPKLAALSHLYEMYFDCILPGQFIFQIQKLHEQYGPIIRINPGELHVLDADFHEELFSRTAHRDKSKHNSGRFGNRGSVFSATEHHLHSLRRGALSPMFFKRAIVNFQSVIRDKVEILCRNIEKYADGDGNQILNLSLAWGALAGDLITEYAFGFCYNHLESPSFEESFHEAYVGLATMSHISLHFPWLHTVLDIIPNKIVVKINPALNLLLILKRDLRNITAKMVRGDKVPRTTNHPTIFNEILQSNLPPQEKSARRLSDEALTIVGAGLETTSWALTVASFYIINKPKVLQKLRDELREALPDSSSETDWRKLEKLPYLSACIQEAIRLAYGVTTRLSRVSHTTIKYKNWQIPPGIPVSMSTVMIHHDENIFPDSHSYIPERWLDNPRTKDGSPLNRYFVSFGKDGRSCLGINLALAELSIALAMVFTRFDFELYETDISDVKLAHDYFIPFPKQDSKGIRVKVKLCPK